MNKYAELRQRQQDEFNALPLGFAFGNEQFKEMMEGWGLNPIRDLNKIYSIGAGGYVQKKDADLFHQTQKRHSAELAAALEDDATGEGFIYQMFLTVLRDHEYGYTRDLDETLDALGYTLEEVLGDPRLNRGLGKAIAEILKEE